MASTGRNRFALEVARAVAAAIGRDRVGIRLSPYGVFNGTGAFPEVQAQTLALTRACRHWACSTSTWSIIRRWAHRRCRPTSSAAARRFDGLFILSGGFDRDSAQRALETGRPT